MSILAPFWVPSWGPKMYKLPPRGLLGPNNIFFVGAPRGVKKERDQKTARHHAAILGSSREFSGTHGKNGPGGVGSLRKIDPETDLKDDGKRSEVPLGPNGVDVAFLAARN